MPRDPAKPHGEPRKGSSAADLALEVSHLQARLLGRLHEEMDGAGGEEYLKAAQDLAKAFGAVTAAAIDPLSRGGGEAPAPPASDPSLPPVLDPRLPSTLDPRLPPTVSRRQSAGQPGEQVRDEPRAPGLHMPPLYRSHEMRRRLAQLIETYKRYGHPFGLAVFDVDGPELREEDGSAETVRTVLGVALNDSVRLIDDSFRLDEDGLCVLAPNQNTVGGVQMAERLLDRLEDLEAVGGLRIAITAGVVACPEHGIEAKQLLEGADEAMWRARAVGEPVGVGTLQAR
jgi:diguanylate cyclase (GGDEF)-like protein